MRLSYRVSTLSDHQIQLIRIGNTLSDIANTLSVNIELSNYVYVSKCRRHSKYLVEKSIVASVMIFSYRAHQKNII